MKTRARNRVASLLITMSMAFTTLANTTPEALPVSSQEVYTDLLESSVTFGAREIKGAGSDGPITYGAEKEGSSSLITRVMGPNGQLFSEWAKAQDIAFLRKFMSDFTSGRARNRTVVDSTGVDKNLTQEQLLSLRGVDYATVDQAEVLRRFDLFIQHTNGRPFSYLVAAYRQKIFNQRIEGIRTGLAANRYAYNNWVAHFGDSERYIANAHGTSKGWEMNFNPMPTYGEFEQMIRWFKTELQNVGQLFEAPGHQRIVFPKPGGTDAQKAEYNARMGEVLRIVQAYIVARGISGNTGIERANHKSVISDGSMNLDSSSGRGVIRIDTPDRFVQNTYSVELRAGTKDAEVQQFIEQVITSHAAAGEFTGIHKTSDYRLIDTSKFYDVPGDAYQLKRRFGVTEAVATQFYQKAGPAVNMNYQIALWEWENAPYMQGKKQALSWATRKYIETVARSSNAEQVKSALQEWLRTIDLTTTLEHYVQPRMHREKLAQAAIYPVRSGEIDVNRIDLGIEYSARFQNKFTGEFATETLPDGQKAWLQTVSDMTPYERKENLRRMAADLGRQLNGRTVPVVDVSKGDGHGHGLSVSFQVKDKQNRSWRIEWDGVGRTYTEDGKVIPESLRGGHIEIVTPKSVPTYEAMEALYTAMAKNSVIPSHLAGGGHINVDLAPFEGKPRALARFLSIFHAHRGMIAYLFQNMNRNSVAEALDVRAEFARELADFRGTETELKQRLYNERYFNQRLGRKTRNVQIDMASYFQDVIPAEHVHTDFDMKNPNEAWRPQFRVEPNIRKMEIRLFDAPIDAYESSMQIKLVRALMHKALNETSAISGRVQDINHEGYARDYNKAKNDFEGMCRELGLNASEYRIFLARATVQGRQTLSSPHYQTYQQKINERGWRKIAEQVWGRALSTARSSAEALSSSARQWRGNVLPEAENFRRLRQEAARQGAQLRDQHIPEQEVRREIKMGVNCRSVFQ